MTTVILLDLSESKVSVKLDQFSLGTNHNESAFGGTQHLSHISFFCFHPLTKVNENSFVTQIPLQHAYLPEVFIFYRLSFLMVDIFVISEREQTL